TIYQLLTDSFGSHFHLSVVEDDDTLCTFNRKGNYMTNKNKYTALDQFDKPVNPEKSEYESLKESVEDAHEHVIYDALPESVAITYMNDKPILDVVRSSNLVVHGTDYVIPPLYNKAED